MTWMHGVIMTEIQSIPIKKLTLLERNPRKITADQMAKLCNSLEQDPDFFNSRPCLANEGEDGTLTVYAGNQRVRAAKKLKWTHVPCIIEKGLSEDVMKERVIRDNAHYGSWDWDILGNEWEVDILLRAGLTESELQINVPDVPDEEENEKAAKKKCCPNCGHEF